MSLPKIRVSAFTAGTVLGVGAALVQAYFKVIPPPAYGICMVCHARDLMNWLADHLFYTDWGYTTASITVPVLTVVGVVVGASLAAWQHGEFRLRPVREPIFFFVTGFLVMNFGLILGACPIRILIVSAYGNLIGIVGWLCVVVGALLGTVAIRWSARRYVQRRTAT